MAIHTPNANNLFLSWGFPPDPHRGPLGEIARGTCGMVHLYQAGYYAVTTALISLLIASPAGILGGMVFGATSWLTGLGARQVARWADVTDNSKAVLAITVCKVVIAAAIGLGIMSLAGIPIAFTSALILESLSLPLIPLSSLAALISTNLPWAYASHNNAEILPIEMAVDTIGNRPLAHALPPDAQESPVNELLDNSVGTLAFLNLCQATYYTAIPALLLGGVGALLGVISWTTGLAARQVVQWGNLMDKPWAMTAIVVCKIFVAAAVGTAAIMLLGAPTTFFAALPALMSIETTLLFLLPTLSHTMLLSTTLPMLYSNSTIEAPNEPEPIISPTVMLGADLITDELLQGASENTLQLFVEMDPSLFHFIATKAIFLYALGAKRSEEIPHFFQPRTRGLIQLARDTLPNPSPAAVAFMEPLFETLEQFNIEPQLPSAVGIVNLLKGYGFEEIQGTDSVLTTSSYHAALATIEAGANLIKAEVGANASAYTLQLFQDKEIAFRHFIATKAVFLYSLGEKRQENIPHFFRPTTREQIQFLREQPDNPEFLALVNPLMETLENFTGAPPENVDLAELLALLKNQGAEEIEDNHSLLNTHCYQLALTDSAAVVAT